MSERPNDGEWNLKTTVEEFGNYHDKMTELEFEGVNIAVYHGTEEAVVEGLVEKNYDNVFRNHTHEKKDEENSGSIELNPGGT